MQVHVITASADEVRTLFAEMFTQHLTPFLTALQNPAQPTETPEFLTTQQALALLQISKPTLLKMREEGVIQGYRVHEKRVLYERRQLEAYLKRNHASKQGV